MLTQMAQRAEDHPPGIPIAKLIQRCQQRRLQRCRLDHRIRIGGRQTRIDRIGQVEDLGLELFVSPFDPPSSDGGNVVRPKPPAQEEIRICN